MSFARVVATALVLAWVLAGAPAGQAAFPGQNGKLAFTADGPTVDADIHVHDGRRLGNLTLDAVKDYDPAWSADGRRIAWERYVDAGTPEIFVMNADGSGGRQLTRGVGEGTDPAWSPDGTRIAYYGSGRGPRADQFGLFIVNTDGSGERFVGPSYGEGFIDTEPAWSPDGTRIAVRSRTADGAERGLYLLAADGTGRTRLTNGDDGSPVWAPDGSRLAFIRFSEGFDVYVVNADGSGLRPVVPAPLDSPYEVFKEGLFWSPDGRTLGYHAEVDLLGVDLGLMLLSPCCTVLVDPDGSPQGTLLTGAIDGDWQPCFADCRPPFAATRAPGPPRPTARRTFAVIPLWGVAAVRPRGNRGFEPLLGPRSLPIGSSVDVTAGAVELRIARGSDVHAVQFSAVPPQFNIEIGFTTRYFRDPPARGVFTVTQRSSRTAAEFRLTGGDFGSCARRGRPGAASQRVVRQVFGEMVGRRPFALLRTTGRYSSMVPSERPGQGLSWGLQDRCDGTRNEATDIFGTWLVRDFARGRTVRLPPRIGGAEYLARARRTGRRQ